MRTWLVGLGLAVLGACGGETAVCHRDGGAACFELPTEVMGTYGPGGISDPLSIGCGAIVPTPAAMAVTLGGTLTDYSSNQPVVGATFEVFQHGDHEGTPIASATTDASGAYSMTLPSGTSDLLSGAIAGGGVIPELRDQLRPDLGQATAALDVTTGTAEVLDQVAQGVGVDRDAGLGQVWVRVLDCNRFAIVHAVVVLSATPGVRDFVDGVPLFYSTAGAPFPLPNPDGITATTSDGTAVALNVPLAGAQYVQAWGFVDAAAAARGDEASLVLVAERAVSRRAGTITRVELWANQ